MRGISIRLKWRLKYMNIIFDMDGLMFDTEKVFIKAWDYAGDKIGIGKAGFMAARRRNNEVYSCQI